MPSSAITGFLEVALADVAEASACVPLLARHWEIVSRWQLRLNLTAIIEPQQVAWLHYRDSLEALSALQPGAVVDLGSGAGFPGIPLAICRPDTPVVLVEERRRKASFLETAVAELGLRNARVIHGRMEDAPNEGFDNAVTRATFSSNQDLTACCAWVKDGGRFIAMRSAASGLTGSEIRAYRLQGSARMLEIFHVKQFHVKQVTAQKVRAATPLRKPGS